MSQLRSASQLPPPSAFPAPTHPCASLSPIREATLGAVPPPGYVVPVSPVALGVSPVRQREGTPSVVGVAPSLHLGVGMVPQAAVDELRHEKEVLKSALHEAAKETQYLTQTLTTVTNTLRDEEAGHALALRQGQDSLAGSRRDYESRLEELQQQLQEARMMMKQERDAHLERMQIREAEHLAALQAERQQGNTRLNNATTETQDAVQILQEQLGDMNALLEGEKMATKEANSKVVDARRDLQDARDDIVKERALGVKCVEEIQLKESSLRTQVVALEENLEANVREMTGLRGMVAQLEERVLGLTQQLLGEREKVIEAEDRSQRAELMAQQSAQTATACELRAIESQREATIRSKALIDTEQHLAFEKERNIVMTAHHAADSASVRRLQTELRSSPPTLPRPWATTAYNPAASIRSVSKASLSLS